MNSAIFNTATNFDDFFNFFIERNLIEQNFDIINWKLEESICKYFEISSEGDSILIAFYNKNSKDLEDEFNYNLSLNYAILAKNDFSDYIFLKRNEGTGKTLKLRKKRGQLDGRFRRKLDSLEYDNIDSFEKIFDRSEFIEDFYKRYSNTEKYLIKKIRGIPLEEDKELFAQLIMQRIMFLWFLQKKEFLNNDENYLISEFNKIETKNGNYHADFLKKLFFQGLCNEKEKREESIKDLIGNIPYLNGGLFVESEVELKYGNLIKIDNEAFFINKYLIDLNEKNIPVLNLMDCRDWTIDEHSGEVDKIDPEILGYIFEKSINKRSLGAVYTPEEITIYINKNTIYPYICDKINQEFGTNYEFNENIKNDFLKKLDQKQLENLFEIIKDLKIIDPAVGSGHFLVDAIIILEKIYLFLRKKKIIGWSNFKIRKFIITENLFGVDLLKGASEICKLRLFLALAETFSSIEDIQPLPNIEFNIRFGNSLIGFISPEELDQEFFSRGPVRDVLSNNLAFLRNHLPIIAENVGEILTNFGAINPNILFNIRNELVRKYRNLHDHSLQTEFRSVIYQITHVFNHELNNNLYKNILPTLKKDKRFNKEYLELIKKNKGKKMPSLGTYIHKNFIDMIPFHWVMEYSEIIENGGFDIIIGNPPYVRQEKIKELKPYLKSYSTFNSTSDLSLYFIERSIDLLKNGNYHSFVITNKWFRANYGLNIRKYLNKIDLVEIIDFDGLKVFKGINVDVAIYIIKKMKTENNLFEFFNPITLKKFENKERTIVRQEDLDDDGWTFISAEKSEIKKWMEKTGKPLKNSNMEVYRGLTLGFNDAFVIDTKTKDLLIKKDPKSAEFIKPLFRGRDIEKYYVEWQNLWIIVVPSGFTKKLTKKNNISDADAEDFFREFLPAIYEHISHFKNVVPSRGKGLLNRDDQGDFWWELRSCEYYHEFEKQKIISTKATKEPSFVLERINGYLLNTSYCIPINDKSILMILNSDMSNFYFKNAGSKLSKMFEPKVSEIKKFPLIIPKNKYKKTFELVADYLLFLKSTEKGRSEYKKFIKYFDYIANLLTYELYFKEKFNLENLYLESNCLIESLASHLVKIDYEKWAKIYWGRKLENISEKELNLIKKLEQNNLKQINESYNAINNDLTIQKQMDLIKTHSWIKIIEDDKIN